MPSFVASPARLRLGSQRASSKGSLLGLKRRQASKVPYPSDPIKDGGGMMGGIGAVPHHGRPHPIAPPIFDGGGMMGDRVGGGE